MEFFCEIEKTDNGMVIRPLYSSDMENLSKLKQGTQYKFKITKDRNVLFHKKGMALFQLGFQNQEKINNFDHYRKLVVMRAGYFDTIETSKGAVYLPHSISFSSMDEITFEELFKRVLDVICEQLDTAPEIIKEQLESYY